MNTSIIELFTNIIFLLALIVVDFLLFVFIKSIKMRKSIPNDPEEALPFYEKIAKNNKVIFISFISLSIVVLPISILATIFINLFHILKVVCFTGILITSVRGYITTIEIQRTTKMLHEAIEERNELRKKYFSPRSSFMTEDFKKANDSE